MARKPTGPKNVEALRHGDTRINIPTAEMQSFFQREEDHSPRPPTAYPRARPLEQGEVRLRDGDKDPQIVWNGLKITLSDAQIEKLTETGSLEIGDAQLVWRGKDVQDWSDLIVNTPPLYIQEKIHPKAIIEDLKRQTAKAAAASTNEPGLFGDLFADFNGVPKDAASDFYQHPQHWSNRMILGDSLSVMASLAERERLKGKVQCIYFDPPYGIKFNSNWQVSTQSRDVKDGKQTDISREPEQVKAFRDTWKDGIHSYLTYLRDRLTVMRDLLTESGSIFVQISDENVHRVRAVMDEVFGEDNFVSEIALSKATGLTSDLIASTYDIIIWFAKNKKLAKYRQLYRPKPLEDELKGEFRWVDQQRSHVRRLADHEIENPKSITLNEVFRSNSAVSPGVRANTTGKFKFQGMVFDSGSQRNWKTTIPGMLRLCKANRILPQPKSVRIYKQFWSDFDQLPLNNFWLDVRSEQNRIYVVQTVEKAIQRCILMASDPGDLVLDPTCGSGTTAYVAEQFGRRWITIDTSRVALALARTRLMSARYPWYLLADSREGAAKEAELTGRVPMERTYSGDIRQGFVYERVPHVMLSSIAGNGRIDDIWDKWEEVLEPLRAEMNAIAGEGWEEWQVPRELPDNPLTSPALKQTHARWWEARIARQAEIDKAIAEAADSEFLYDRPYPDASKVRVAGPFTVESLSPHRIVPSDTAELVDELNAADGKRSEPDNPETDFAQVVIEYLKSVGIHQSDKNRKIVFDSVNPWPGRWIGAEARFMEGDAETGTMRRAGILIGPEYGTVSRPDLTAAAREANETGFDVLIACAFNFDAHSSELDRLGPLPILKARMNPDLHMADELKNTGKGNLFVIFGEPDIDIISGDDGRLQVKVNGVDVYDPNTGDIRSNDVRDIAAWFIDTDYNEESFFVRHAYFLGANDPYEQLRKALKAEIDESAWSTLYRSESRPFDRPANGVIAVKVINHFGDEVMKVYRV
jgi:adenine-specific DNA-methyltransferase